jgi:hypothetical protein
MRKLNYGMVTISWIVTLVFAVLLIIQWSNLAKIQTPYGSPATSPPYILGMLISNALVPSILWLITYFTAPKLRTTKNNWSDNRAIHLTNDYNDPEVNILQQKIKSFKLELERLKADGNLLNRSINQNLISENSYNSEMDKLDSAIYSIRNKKDKYENRLTAIFNISAELYDLEELSKKNLISIYQKETKRNELINHEIKCLLKFKKQNN